MSIFQILWGEKQNEAEGRDFVPVVLIFISAWTHIRRRAVTDIATRWECGSVANEVRALRCDRRFLGQKNNRRTGDFVVVVVRLQDISVTWPAHAVQTATYYSIEWLLWDSVYRDLIIYIYICVQEVRIRHTEAGLFTGQIKTIHRFLWRLQ